MLSLPVAVAVVAVAQAQEADWAKVVAAALYS